MVTERTTWQMTKVDWPSFLAHHDLHFSELPTGWNVLT